MHIVDGFVIWSSGEDKESFMEMCEPFDEAPAAAGPFLEWVGQVVRSHMQSSPDKQLLATYLSVLVSELAPDYLLGIDGTHGVVTDRFVGDTGCSSHVISGLGKVGNASLLH